MKEIIIFDLRFIIETKEQINDLIDNLKNALSIEYERKNELYECIRVYNGKNIINRDIRRHLRILKNKIINKELYSDCGEYTYIPIFDEKDESIKRFEKLLDSKTYHSIYGYHYPIHYTKDGEKLSYRPHRMITDTSEMIERLNYQLNTYHHEMFSDGYKSTQKAIRNIQSNIRELKGFIMILHRLLKQ